MSNKVLLITQVFYPDEVSTANLFTNLCSELVKTEVEVDVWCAHPSYTNIKKQPRKLIHKGISISYLPSTNFRKSLLLGRLTNYFTFTLSVFFKLLFSGEKSLVITHTTPPSLGVFLSVICSLKNRKFIYVLLDIFPEGLIRLGKISRSNIFVIIWQAMFRLSLRRADMLIVIGRDMLSLIEKEIGKKGKRNKKDKNRKISYIPLWQDEDLIVPVDFYSNVLVKDLGLTDKFVVQYSGNMGLWNDMSTIGKAVCIKPENVFFLLIGDGMQKKDFLHSFNGSLPENLLMLPFQSNSSFRDSVTACHVGLISLNKGLEGMAVPSKIYGIMAAAIPVIAIVPFESEIAMIVREEECGIVVNPGDQNGIINAILQLKSDEELRIIMGLNGRKAFEKKYTTRRIAQKYRSMINEISN